MFSGHIGSANFDQGPIIGLPCPSLTHSMKILHTTTVGWVNVNSLGFIGQSTRTTIKSVYKGRALVTHF